MNRHPADGGYTLVLVIIFITVMNIAVAAALPLWSTVIRREKEEELVFRGMQYAEAIRVFRARHGRLPNRLDELIKVHPRALRQLWVDPMTGEQDWVLILSTAAGKNTRGRNLRGGQHPGNTPPPAPPEGEESPKGPDGKPLALGPIRGVHSRSTEQSKRLFFGRDRYDQWQFSIDLLTSIGDAPADPSKGTSRRKGQALRLSIRHIGRPLPGGLGGNAGSGLAPSAMKTTNPSGKRGRSR